ncbi:hypothetical protein DBR06_SOUSAS7410031, partial [Sousa chinensis]
GLHLLDGGYSSQAGSGWNWGDVLRRDTHMSCSSLQWEEFKNLPGSLN